MTPATSPAEPTTFRNAIAERIRVASPTLRGAARQLLEASGKGIRPLCVRLVAETLAADNRASARHEQFGEAIELLHVGTLIHDDILDEAEVRRGVRSVHISWGVKTAVLAGDYLLAQSSQLVGQLDELILAKRLSEVIGDLVEGEILQDEQLRNANVTMEDYLERVAKKTASPFEFAAEGAAILAGAQGRQVAVARRMGFHLGRLFQLVDDWLDWASSEAELGKPVGQDLAAGSLTLPVLVALQDPRVGPNLRAALTPFPAEIPPHVRALVLDPQVQAETRRLVLEEADRARQWLLELPSNAARAQIEGMLTALVARVQQ